MKKLIFAALVVVSTGVLSAFTLKNDTAVTVSKHDTSDKKDLGTADTKKDLGTADAKTSPKHSATNDKKDLGTAD